MASSSNPQPQEKPWEWKRPECRRVGARITLYNNKSVLRDITTKLLRVGSGPSLLNRFVDGCFGHLLACGGVISCGKALHELFAHEIKIHGSPSDQYWFRICGQNLRFYYPEFALASGLSFGTSDFDPTAPHKPEGTRAYNLFRNGYGGRVNMRDLLTKFKNCSEDVDPTGDCFLKVANILALYYFVLGYRDTKIIDSFAWVLVDNLEVWNAFPWGAYSYQAFTHYMSLLPNTKAECKEVYSFYGPAWVLQIWSYKAIPYLSEKVVARKRCSLQMVTVEYTSFFEQQNECEQFLEPDEEEVKSVHWLSVVTDSPLGVKYIAPPNLRQRRAPRVHVSEGDQKKKRRGKIRKISVWDIDEESDWEPEVLMKKKSRKKAKHTVSNENLACRLQHQDHLEDAKAIKTEKLAAQGTRFAAPYFSSQSGVIQFTMLDDQVRIPTRTITDMSSIPSRQEPALKNFSIDEASTGEKNQISSDGQLKTINTPKSSSQKLVQNTLSDSCKNLFTSQTNQASRGAQNQVTKLLMTEHATDGAQNGRQVSTHRFRRKRSKSPIRERSLALLLENNKHRKNSPSRTGTMSRAEQNIEILNNPLTCMEALAADTRSTVPTKKRSKRSTFINSTVQNMYNHQNIAGTSMGPPLDLNRKTMSPVDSIADKLNQLDLKAGSRSLEKRKSSTGGGTTGTDSYNKTLSYIEHSDVTHDKEAKKLQEFEDGTIREVGSIREGNLKGESIDTPLAPVISSDIIGSSQNPDISVVKLLKLPNTVLHGIKSDEDNTNNPTVPAETIKSCTQSSLSGVPKPVAHQTVEGKLVETEKFGVGDFDAQVRVPTNTITDRSSILASHLLVLNAPPKMIMEAVLRRKTSRFLPDHWTYTMR